MADVCGERLFAFDEGSQSFLVGIELFGKCTDLIAGKVTGQCLGPPPGFKNSHAACQFTHRRNDTLGQP